jgi:hypothetical protein
MGNNEHAHLLLLLLLLCGVVQALPDGMHRPASLLRRIRERGILPSIQPPSAAVAVVLRYPS